VFGSGIVACYDLDGNRQWVRYLDQPQVSQYGRSASPVLAAGRLLVSLSGLTALDPLTGAVLWDAPAAQASFGTPAVVRIGDVQLAVTSQGDCVRLSDGRIVATKLASMTYTSPGVAGDVVYFAAAPTVAYQLAEQADHEIQPKKLWENDDVEGEFYASPVCHEGILYCVANEGQLFAIDAQTGETIYQQELDIRSASGRFGAGPAEIYPSLALVGPHLLLSNDVGETLVLKPGRQYQEVARNSLASGSGASPAPDGPFLFLRGGGNLFCVGSKLP
jgi:outer membrane protein assembly factor BamB